MNLLIYQLGPEARKHILEITITNIIVSLLNFPIYLCKYQGVALSNLRLRNSQVMVRAVCLFSEMCEWMFVCMSFDLSKQQQEYVVFSWGKVYLISPQNWTDKISSQLNVNIGKHVRHSLLLNGPIFPFYTYGEWRGKHNWIMNLNS